MCQKHFEAQLMDSSKLGLRNRLICPQSSYSFRKVTYAVFRLLSRAKHLSSEDNLLRAIFLERPKIPTGPLKANLTTILPEDSRLTVLVKNHSQSFCSGVKPFEADQISSILQKRCNFKLTFSSIAYKKCQSYQINIDLIRSIQKVFYVIWANQDFV